MVVLVWWWWLDNYLEIADLISKLLILSNGVVTGGYKQQRRELGSRKILNPGSRWDQLNSYCRKEYFQEYKWAGRCLIFACLSCKTPNWVGLFCVTECLVTIMADNWLCGIITSSQALQWILISSPTSPSLIWRLPRLISRQNICTLLGVFEVLSDKLNLSLSGVRVDAYQTVCLQIAIGTVCFSLWSEQTLECRWEHWLLRKVNSQNFAESVLSAVWTVFWLCKFETCCLVKTLW